MPVETPATALTGSSSETMVALGRFSWAQASPVVPDWQAIFTPSAFKASAVVLSESALTTTPWLESM